MLLPLQGVYQLTCLPKAMPWAIGFWAYSPFLNNHADSAGLYWRRVILAQGYIGEGCNGESGVCAFT